MYLQTLQSSSVRTPATLFRKTKPGHSGQTKTVLGRITGLWNRLLWSSTWLRGWMKAQRV